MDDARTIAWLRAWQVMACAGLIALLLPACSTPYIGTTAVSFLSRIKNSRDPNIRYVAYAKLGSPECYDSEEQKLVAIRVLLAVLEANREPIASRAVICRTLGELGKPEARPALLKALGDDEAVVRCEAARALGKVGKPDDATELARVMTVDQNPDCQVAAIEALGDLKSHDVRINTLLVGGMEHRSPAIRLACYKALQKITGKSFDPDPTPWRKYILGDAEHERTKAKGDQTRGKVGQPKSRSDEAKAKSEQATTNRNQARARRQPEQDQQDAAAQRPENQRRAVLPVQGPT